MRAPPRLAGEEACAAGKPDSHLIPPLFFPAAVCAIPLWTVRG